MKKFRNVPVLLLVVSLLLLNSSIVSAVPPLPSSFWGTVRIDGSNVPLDTVITARVNGIMYASKMVEVYQGATVYSLDVPGDDLSTLTEIEGGKAGQTVVFYIGSQLATPNGSWSSGTNVRINLTLAPNVAPVVSNIPDQVIQEPASFTTIALDDYVTDATDGDSLITWTYSGNTQLTVSISPSRVATITYPAGWTGSEVITFRATDPGGLFSTDSAMFRRYTTSSIVFTPGLNLITLPLRPFSDYDSETLLNAINGATSNCTEIHRWINGGWESYYLGLPFGQFPIDMGQG